MHATLDFQISQDGEKCYAIRVFDRNSPQPLAESQFEHDPSYLAQFEINQLEHDAKDPQARMDRLTDFGQKLYTKVFTDPVG